MTHRLLALLACIAVALAGAAWLPQASAEPVRSVRTPARPAHAGHGSITEGLDCSLCHTTAGWKSIGNGASEGGFDHARTGFPLRGRHAHVACTGCHQGGEQITRECTGCHRDAHQNKLGSDCTDCHSADSWQQVRAFARHRMTRLPLTGMHALADCTDCHRRTTDGQWSAVPADCFACHQDQYRRTDIHPLHVGGAGNPASAPFSRDCALCHRATGWSPAVISADGFRASVTASGQALALAPGAHEIWFPIAHGAHRGALCQDCHASETVPRALRCTGCHAHSPARLQQQHRAGVSLQAGTCLGCHPSGAAR